MARKYNDNIRPIPPFPRKERTVKTLPGWHGKKVTITIDVSLLDRARLLAHETITYSANTTSGSITPTGIISGS